MRVEQSTSFDAAVTTVLQSIDNNEQPAEAVLELINKSMRLCLDTLSISGVGGTNREDDWVHMPEAPSQ